MPFVPVPKDLTKIKNKIALGMTKRQLIFSAISVGVGLCVYLGTKNFIGLDLAVIIIPILVSPIFLMGFYQDADGRTLEKKIRIMLKAKYLRPGIRPYRTENIYAELSRDINFRKEGIRIVASNAKKSTKKSSQKKTKPKQEINHTGNKRNSRVNKKGR